MSQFIIDKQKVTMIQNFVWNFHDAITQHANGLDLADFKIRYMRYGCGEQPERLFVTPMYSMDDEIITATLYLSIYYKNEYVCVHISRRITGTDKRFMYCKLGYCRGSTVRDPVKILNWLVKKHLDNERDKIKAIESDRLVDEFSFNVHSDVFPNLKGFVKGERRGLIRLDFGDHGWARIRPTSATTFDIVDVFERQSDRDRFNRIAGIITVYKAESFGGDA